MAMKCLLPLLLVCFHLPATAAEVRQLSANGGGGACPPAAQAVEDDGVGTQLPGKRSAATPPKAADKLPARRGGTEDPQVRPPRWHSFLPGMFR